MRRQPVVTVFLLRRDQDGDRILVLRRSQRVGSFRGRWAGISGYLEREPLEQALLEVEEETGLTHDQVQLLRTGIPFEVVDSDRGMTWVVHPFLFAALEPDAVRLDWEHDELRWIEPAEIAGLGTVLDLDRSLAAVYP